MTITLNGTTGITSPGGDTASVSLATPIVSSPSSLTLQTNGSTTAVTVTTAQNVGIGTTSPNTLLEVFGAAGFGYAFSVDQNISRPQGSISLSGTNIASTPTYTSPGGSTTVGQIYNYASIADSFYRYLDIVAFSSTTGAGSSIRFITGTGYANVERARFNPSGAFVFAGGTTTANGIGITFPATQSASSDPNTLDDYEEGTWTPTDASGAGLSFTVNSATYTKIGRVVYATCYVTYPTTANTSQASVGNLPFPSANTSNLYIPGVLSTNAAVTAYVRIPPSSSTMPISTISGATNVTNAQMSNNYAIISITYITST